MLEGEDGSRIVIPPIQRDYAQGRNDPKILHLRRELVKDLISALKNHSAPGGSPVDLGLIFGATFGDTITLYDGQQRLTTLFLLHWYLAWRTGNKDASAMLERFSYETRLFSRDFCRWLATKGLDAELVYETDSEKSRILQTLMRSPEFCSAWLDDPTVSGMIVMLEEIHAQIHPLSQASDEPASKELADHLWQQLISGQRIQFTWLIMEPAANNQPDESLYIRLNGRGRTLTEFEKFKAWLEDQKLEGIVPIKWKDLLDTTWLNLFWKASGSDPDATSSSMMAFFLGVALNEKLRCHESDGTKKEKKGAETKKITDQIQRVTKGDGITPDDWNELFTPVAVNTIFKLLDRLSSSDWCRRLDEVATEGKLLLFSETFMSKSEMAENELFTKAFVAHWTSTGLKERLIHFALTRLIGDLDSSSGTPPREQAIRFLRTVRNYAENTTVESSSYTSSIKLIAEVSLDHDFLPHGSPDPGSDQPSEKELKTQWEEECYKAAMFRNLSNDPSHLSEEERAFRAAEDQPFLRGQIGFLIKMAGGTNAFDLEKFSKYAKCLGLLFPEGKVPREPFLLQRALLSKGDYSVQDKSKWSLGHDQSEWRKIFCEHIDLLKSLLDDVTTKTSTQTGGIIQDSVELALGEIISEMRADWSDWRTWMVNEVLDKDGKTWHPLTECSERKFAWLDHGSSVLLVDKHRLSSDHVELRTYLIWKKFLDKANWKYKENESWTCHAYYETGDRRIEVRYLGAWPDKHPPGQPFATRVLSKSSARPTDWPAVDSEHGIALSEAEKNSGWPHVGHFFAACDPELIATLVKSVANEVFSK